MVDINTFRELGLDVEEGLAYCADDPEFYKEMLAEYVAEGENRINELNNYFDNGDWKAYGIRAHSVKSTSGMIGAADLSEHAREMETAAKAGDENAIREGHKEFLRDYGELVESIRKRLDILEDPEETVQ